MRGLLDRKVQIEFRLVGGDEVMLRSLSVPAMASKNFRDKNTEGRGFKQL